MLDLTRDPGQLPPWLEETDLDVYTSAFERSGFGGGLNWYRAIDLSWELTAAWDGAPVTVPALFLVGSRDLVYHFPGMSDAIDHLDTSVPNLHKAMVLEGCGHWTQQERPAEVNRAMLEFLDQVGH